MIDAVDADLFAAFDLDEMRALEEGDLSLLSSLADPSFRFGPENSPKMDKIVMGMEEEDPQDLKYEFEISNYPNQMEQMSAPQIMNTQSSPPDYIPQQLSQNNNNNENPQKPKEEEPPAPPPLVVCPIEVGKTSITLQKNQLCACKECGKLFKSIWYLKQHAVRHSNERPFKCNFCQKAFKFRSNLYQHNCPERVRQRGTNTKRLYSRGVAYTEMYTTPKESDTQPIVPPSQTLIYGSPMSQQQQMAPQTPFSSVDTFGYSQMPFEVKAEPYQPNTPQQPQPPQQQQQPSNRHKTLDREYIDNYLQKNRHRIYPCRKCKINFPHREYLQRHLAYHNDQDSRPYGCDQCPQRFATEKQLDSHLAKHSDDSPHRCAQCNGAFRSALALRRHKDQSRQCYGAAIGAYQQIPSANMPLDQYAFIDSDADEDAEDGSVKGLNRQKSATDSGMGSDSSTHSYTTSPINSGIHEDELEHHGVTAGFGGTTSKSPAEKKDEDTDSGFRSRLNSTTQSCSPGSSFSSESSSASPARKFSRPGPPDFHTPEFGGFGIFPYANGFPATKVDPSLQPPAYWTT